MIYFRNSVRNSMIIQNATDAARAAAISMTGRMIIHAALEMSLIVSIVMMILREGCGKTAPHFCNSGLSSACHFRSPSPSHFQFQWVLWDCPCTSFFVQKFVNLLFQRETWVVELSVSHFTGYNDFFCCVHNLSSYNCYAAFFPFFLPPFAFGSGLAFPVGIGAAVGIGALSAFGVTYIARPIS